MQATISSDNYLRVYECLEQPSLSSWLLLEEVDVLGLPTTSPSARSVAHTVTMATPTQPNATLDGNSVSLVAHALQQQAQQSQLPGRPGLGTREVRVVHPTAPPRTSRRRTLTRSRASRPMVAGVYHGVRTNIGARSSPQDVGSTASSRCAPPAFSRVAHIHNALRVQIIQVSPSRRPSTLLSLNPTPSSSSRADGATAAAGGEPDAPKTFAVTSVAWAPSCGRSYHLVAAGSRDGHVRIWRVRPPTAGEDLDGEDGDGRWTATVVGDFDDHKWVPPCSACFVLT